MKKLLLILLAICSISIVQAESKLIISGLSYHVQQQELVDRCNSLGYSANAIIGIDAPRRCKPFNEINYGIGIDEFVTTDSYYTAGMYKNSYNKLSTYIGYGYDFSKYSGIKAGAVTGYPQAIVMPMLAPYLSLPLHKRVSIQIIMPFMPGPTQLIAAQLRITL